MELLRITKQAEKRLPARVLEPLQDAVSKYASWYKGLPEESKLYINYRPVIRPSIKSRRMPLQVEPELAPLLFDYHSILTGQILLRGWRVQQLIEGLTSALASWNITIAAASARGLMETACAWFIESKEIADKWKSSTRVSTQNLETLLAARGELAKSVAQVFAGTRLPGLLKVDKSFERKNVLTFIKKTANTLEYAALIEQYEELCDAVHPSFGSTEMFWAEAGINEEAQQVRVLLSRTAAGQPGDKRTQPIVPGSGLIFTIISSATWACERLLSDLQQFEIFCRDVCLTCRIHTLKELDYWAVVSPTGLYEPCACGSGKTTRFCIHEFGRST